MKLKKVKLSWKTADSLTVDNLKVHIKLLESELLVIENYDLPDVSHSLALDIVETKKLIAHFKTVLEYFGG